MVGPEHRPADRDAVLFGQGRDVEVVPIAGGDVTYRYTMPEIVSHCQNTDIFWLAGISKRFPTFRRPGAQRRLRQLYAESVADAVSFAQSLDFDDTDEVESQWIEAVESSEEDPFDWWRDV